MTDLNHAESHRFVEEAREQRERADAAESDLAALRATNARLVAVLEMHVAKSGHTAGCTQLDVFGCSKRCTLTRQALSSASARRASDSVAGEGG